MQAVFIGVDVSRDTLVIAGSPGRQRWTIANERSQIEQWLKDLPEGTSVAMESTGRYARR